MRPPRSAAIPTDVAEDRAVGAGRALRGCARRPGGARARSCRAARSPAQPRSTQASFQPRSKPSRIAVFSPVPPRGVTRCAASPIRNASPPRKRSASATPKSNAHRRARSRSAGRGRPPLRGSTRVIRSSVSPLERRRPSCPRASPSIQRSGWPAGIGTAGGLAGDEVDAVAVRADELPQRGAEEDRQPLVESVRSPRVGMPSASRTVLRDAVGGDQVAGADPAPAPSAPTSVSA